MERPQRLGIMGGTFDPIHFGHLLAAETARQVFHLQQIIFIPTGNPPHKKQGSSATAEQRWQMTRFAVDGNPYFSTSRMEIEREGFSYSFDTVCALQEQYPQAELYFIVGADAILELPTWKRVDELLTKCHFIATFRPGYDLQALQDILPGKAFERISFLAMPAMDISSTDIRKRLKNGISIKYLLPQKVEDYIYKNNLYDAIKGQVDLFLQERLKEGRVMHCRQTAKTAKELAEIYHIDAQKAELCGLLHDCARGYSFSEQKELAQPFLKQLAPLSDTDGMLFHGPAAAALAQQNWGIEEEEMLNALIYHTVGRPAMSPLEEIIFLADKIEPGRDYEGVAAIRELAKKDRKQAMAMLLQNNLAYLKQAGKEIHPLAVQAAAYYNKKGEI